MAANSQFCRSVFDVLTVRNVVSPETFWHHRHQSAECQVLLQIVFLWHTTRGSVSPLLVQKNKLSFFICLACMAKQKPAHNMWPLFWFALDMIAMSGRLIAATMTISVNVKYYFEAVGNGLYKSCHYCLQIFANELSSCDYGLCSLSNGTESLSQ